MGFDHFGGAVIISFAYNPVKGVLLVTFAVPITRRNLDELNVMLERFVAIHGVVDTIIDCSRATEADAEAISERGSQPTKNPGKQRIFVAPYVWLYDHLQRYATYQEIRGTRPAPLLVKSAREAFDMLGTDPSEFQPVP